MSKQPPFANGHNTHQRFAWVMRYKTAHETIERLEKELGEAKGKAMAVWYDMAVAAGHPNNAGMWIDEFNRAEAKEQRLSGEGVE